MIDQVITWVATIWTSILNILPAFASLPSQVSNAIDWVNTSIDYLVFFSPAIGQFLIILGWLVAFELALATWNSGVFLYNKIRGSG